MLQIDGPDVKDRQQSLKQAVKDATVETKSNSAGLLDWALSSLYFTAGVGCPIVFIPVYP